MLLNSEVMGNLIPDDEPSEELVPEAARILARHLINQPLLYRSYLWASALLDAGFRSAIPVPARFVHASAGFVPIGAVTLPQKLANLTPGVTFGLYVLAEGTGESTIQLLQLAGRFFPVVTTYGEVQLHGGPPNPINATSTCWVRNTGNPKQWKEGILTCRHAVRTLPMGTPVALTPSVLHSTPASSTLADRNACTIDAAILEIQPSDWPSGLTRLNVAHPSAPGQAVAFEDRAGALHNGHILRVFNYNTYIGNLFGQRVIADCHASAGDSGSFLRDTSTNEAVGIYMGTIPDGAGGMDGIFQDLAQVESFFQVEIHY
jgi:hypothetical protein